MPLYNNSKNQLPVLKPQNLHYVSERTINFPVINWKGHLLPDWLFFIPKIQDTFVSPAAQFKPVAALEGSPWQSTTVPNQQKQTKTLIIDRSFYLHGLNQLDLLAQIEWFKLQEISVYLCVEQEGTKQLISCDQEEMEFEKKIDSLSYFDEDTDYEQLAAKSNLVRDKTAVLNITRSQQLFACMHQEKRYLVPINKELFPSYRFYDASTYAIHIPYVSTLKNKVVKVDELRITNSDIPNMTSIANLIKEIIDYPHQIHELLEENEYIVTTNYTLLFSLAPAEFKKTIHSFCYDRLGLATGRIVCDVDYYIDLKNKLSVYDLPLETMVFPDEDALIRLKQAFPKLEERLDVLMKPKSITMTLFSRYFIPILYKVFPHKAHEIYHNRPVINFYDLASYINACPEEADSLIERYFPVIEESSNSVEKDDLFINAFWDIFKLAKSTKEKLDKLVSYQDLSYTELVKYLAGDPPNFEDVIQLILSKPLRSRVYIDLINANSKVVPYILEKNTFKFDVFFLNYLNNRDLKRTLYDTLKPPITCVDDIMSIGEFYPEYFDAMLEEHLDMIEESQVFFIEKLPVDIALKLIERFPEKANVRHTFNTFLQLPEWQDPRIIAHIFKKLIRGKAPIDTLCSFYDEFSLLSSDLVEQIIMENVLINQDNSEASTAIKTISSFWKELKNAETNQPQISSNKLQSLLPTPEFAHHKEQPSFNECTSLTIGMFNDKFNMDVRLLPNLRSLKINLITVNSEKLMQFFDDLKQHCPKLGFINLPQHVQQQTHHLPYKMTYHAHAELKITNKVAAIKESSETSETTPPHSSHAPKTNSPYLFVANNDLVTNTSGTGSSDSFNMVKSGELLNGLGRALHRIRTQIVEIDDNDFSVLRSKIPHITSIPLPQTITPELINQCKNTRDDFYYHMTIQTRANQPVRLLSMDAQEQLIALQASGVHTELFHGDDDFYYVKTDKDCELSYIIKAPEPQSTLKYTLSNDDPIKTILDVYFHSPTYTTESETKLSKNDDETYPAWFDRLYKTGQGSCRERCFGVWFQICKDNSLRERVRLVRIDNMHMLLEIKTPEGNWIQVDLGGIKATFEYDNRQTYKAETMAVDTKGSTENYTDTLAKTILSSSEFDKTWLNNVLSPQQVTDTFMQMEALINGQKNPRIINKLEQVFEFNKSPVMIIHQNREACAQEFLNQARQQNKPVFFLHDPNQIAVGKEQIHLQEGVPVISSLDALDLFKKEHRGNPDAMILIDWAAFTPQKQVALNSVLDPKQSLYGKKLHFKTFSICPELPKDSSFVSRHKELVKPRLPIPEVSEEESFRQMDFDLKGLPDWQERLFGPIFLNKNKSCWKKSKFILALEDANQEPLKISLKNIPAKAIQEVKTLLQRAKAQGYFEYHHQKLPVPTHIQFKVDSSDLDFKNFLPVNMVKGVNATQLPSEFHLVNTELFDYLLTNKQVLKGEYQQLPGWLKQARGQKLSLFITSDLSKNQWYCLLERAQHYQVELSLNCAPGVSVPSEVKVNLVNSENKALDFSQDSLVYVSNNPKQCIVQNDDTLSFAIEDYSYQDLMGWVDHRFENNQFTDFNERLSDVQHALMDGKTVILYGEFSTPVLRALQPMILS